MLAYKKKNFEGRPWFIAEQRFENTVEECKNIGCTYGYD